MLLRGELRKYAKYSNFENFESALNSTSGSMPLSYADVRYRDTQGSALMPEIHIHGTDGLKCPPKH